MDCLPLPELCHHLELQWSMTLAPVKTPQASRVILGLGGVGGKTRPLHSFSGQKLFLQHLFHSLCTYVLFQKPTSLSLAWFLLFAEPLRAEPACPCTMSSWGSSGSPPRRCFCGLARGMDSCLWSDLFCFCCFSFLQAFCFRKELSLLLVYTVTESASTF